MKTRDKNMKTYYIVRFFYHSHVIECILNYYKNYDKQIHLQKIKHQFVLRDIQKKSKHTPS